MILIGQYDSPFVRRVGLALANTNRRNVKAWATIDADAVVRVLLINKDAGFSGSVDISLPDYAAPRSYALASVGEHESDGYDSCLPTDASA